MTTPKKPTRAEALAACDIIEHILSKDMKSHSDCLVENIKFLRQYIGPLSATDAPIVDWKAQKEAVFLWADEHGFTPVESEVCDLLNVLIPPVSERVDGLESAIHNLKDASGDWCELNAKDIQDLQTVLKAARLYAQGRTQSAVRCDWCGRTGCTTPNGNCVEVIESAAPPVTGGALQLPASGEYKTWQIEYYKRADGKHGASVCNDQADENPMRPLIYRGEGATDLEAVTDALSKAMKDEPAPPSSAEKEGV